MRKDKHFRETKHQSRGKDPHASQEQRHKNNQTYKTRKMRKECHVNGCQHGLYKRCKNCKHLFCQRHIKLRGDQWSLTLPHTNPPSRACAHSQVHPNLTYNPPFTQAVCVLPVKRTSGCTSGRDRAGEPRNPGRSKKRTRRRKQLTQRFITETNTNQLVCQDEAEEKYRHPYYTRRGNTRRCSFFFCLQLFSLKRRV